MSHSPEEPFLPRIGSEAHGIETGRDDPALPPEIEEKVEQLAERERAVVRERAHELATEAVEAALEEVVSGAVTPEELVAEPGLGQGRR